jgi:hypothetical protein
MVARRKPKTKKNITKVIKEPTKREMSQLGKIKKHAGALTYKEIVSREPILVRPEMDITDASVEYLGSIGMTVEDVAKFFACSPDHIRQKHIHALNLGRENLKCSLRLKQVNAALSGNVPMLIHLGKVLLGQNEKQIIEVVPTDTVTTKLTDQELLEKMNNVSLIEHKPDSNDE